MVYKLCLLVSKCLLGEAPQYLSDMLMLLSSNAGFLHLDTRVTN